MPSAQLGHRNDTLAVADEHIDPSSSSSSRICLLLPGGEVKSASALLIR